MYKIKNTFKFYFLPENSRALLSIVCFIMGLCCVPISAFLMLYNFPENVLNKDYSNQILSIFFGLWAINLVCIANYLKKN
jgi:hypothetical protein